MKNKIMMLAMLSILVVNPALADSKKTTITTTTVTQNYATKYHTIKHKDLMTVDDRRDLQTDIEKHVRRLDSNQSKAIDRDEFMNFHMNHGVNMSNATDRFTTLDTNANGSISSQEIMDEEMRIRADKALSRMVYYDTSPYAWTDQPNNM